MPRLQASTTRAPLAKTPIHAATRHKPKGGIISSRTPFAPAQLARRTTSSSATPKRETAVLTYTRCSSAPKHKALTLRPTSPTSSSVSLEPIPMTWISSRQQTRRPSSKHDRSKNCSAPPSKPATQRLQPSSRNTFPMVPDRSPTFF